MCRNNGGRVLCRINRSRTHPPAVGGLPALSARNRCCTAADKGRPDRPRALRCRTLGWGADDRAPQTRSEEHTSELQSRGHLVCRLLLEKKKEIQEARRRERSSY